MLKIKSKRVTIQKRASELYFHMALYFTVNYAVQCDSKSADETLVCGTVYYAVLGGSNF